MEIKRLWDGLKDQKSFDTNGNVWSVANLIECSKGLPVMDIPLDHLCVDKRFNEMGLMELASHMLHVQEADISFPIILDANGSIFDGAHRVIKALLNGDKTIKAVRFESDPAPLILGNND